jgi:hypothetical protein
MKRFILCIMVFVLMLWFSGNFVHAKTPNILEINNAEISANIEIEENYISSFSIDGINFGDEPRVSLGNFLLIVDPENSSNDHIEATFQEYIPPGTYRLSVARKGFDFSHPEKADSLDVTISEANNDQESGDTEESSGAFEPGNIYEITQTFDPTPRDPSIITATCKCNDENDIALNGGFKIIDPENSYPELTIMESKIHRDTLRDSYQVRVKNHSMANISIEANVICLSIP